MKGYICHIIISIVLCLIAINSGAQEIYRVEFTEKSCSDYSVDRPEEFLSLRALDRRDIQGIDISEDDLPVCRVYLDSLESKGLEIIHTSRWFNRATVRAYSSEDTTGLLEWSFVKNVKLTKPSVPLKSCFKKFNENFAKNQMGVPEEDYYGLAKDQICQLNGDFLHNAGYRGRGKMIAVIDGGFYKANELAAFDSLWNNSQIIGTCNFIKPGEDVFSYDQHGMNVLSVMGAVVPGEFVGVAPNSSYLLITSEDGSSEYPVEMDNWISAVEYADSMGADVVNSSLGYFYFDEPSYNLEYKDMDGNTLSISKAAQIAVQKGMVVCVSAGNEGDRLWEHIIAPSDGEEVLSVGAVDILGQRASFSSMGPSADGRVKPDVAACGSNTSVIWTDNSVYTANGTSFSAPLISGLAACLWQAFPDLSSTDIVRTIRMSASHALSPDSMTGYGIPDFRKAFEILKNMSEEREESANRWNVYPNPFSDVLTLSSHDYREYEEVEVMVYNCLGAVINTKRVMGGNNIKMNYSDLHTGIYFLQINYSGGAEIHRLIKN